MINKPALPLVKQQIARLCFLNRNACSSLCLLTGSARKGVAEIGKNLLGKSGTVTAVYETRSTPDIRISQKIFRILQKLTTCFAGGKECFCRRIRIGVCLVIPWFYPHFRQGKAFLLTTVYLFFRRFSAQKIPRADKSADVSRFHINPVGIFIRQDIAEASLRQDSDDFLVCAFSFADVKPGIHISDGICFFNRMKQPRHAGNRDFFGLRRLPLTVAFPRALSFLLCRKDGFSLGGWRFCGWH